MKRVIILFFLLVPFNFFLQKKIEEAVFEFSTLFHVENSTVSLPESFEFGNALDEPAIAIRPLIETNATESALQVGITTSAEIAMDPDPIVVETTVAPNPIVAKTAMDPDPVVAEIAMGSDPIVVETAMDLSPIVAETKKAPEVQKELASNRLWNPKKKPPPPRKSYNWLPKRITVEHIQGNQNEIAFGTNYTTVGLVFAPPYKIGKILGMADFRGHRFDDCTYAFNVGAIARYIPYPDSFCTILGFNAYYDYRQGGIGYYQQAGFGVEILGRRWDFRGNAYIPFAGKKHIKVCVFDDFEGDFVITHSFLEEISYSFNAEVGYLALRSKYLLFYLAGGPYYISGRKCFTNTVGGKFRVRPQYKDYIALDLSVSHDPLFNTIYQAEIILSLPLYQIGNQNKNPCGLSDRQIYQPVERFEVMPLMRQSCWRSNF